MQQDLLVIYHYINFIVTFCAVVCESIIMLQITWCRGYKNFNSARTLSLDLFLEVDSVLECL